MCLELGIQSVATHLRVVLASEILVLLDALANRAVVSVPMPHEIILGDPQPLRGPLFHLFVQTADLATSSTSWSAGS